MTLEDYFQTHIWGPLGAQHTTFYPERRPAGSLPPKQAMGYRPGGPKGFAPLTQGPTIMEFPLTDGLGGIGLHSTATDFILFLAALLRGGAPLLGPEGMRGLFAPRLDRRLRKLMLEPLGARTRRVVGVAGFEEEKVDYCFAGTVTMEDLPGRRKKGSASWAGLPNLHWVSGWWTGDGRSGANSCASGLIRSRGLRGRCSPRSCHQVRSGQKESGISDS